MPGLLAETEKVLRFVAEELGPDTYVDLMARYFPGRPGRPQRPGRLWRDRPPPIPALRREAWERLHSLAVR
jgi:hypothetical protein